MLASRITAPKDKNMASSIPVAQNIPDIDGDSALNVSSSAGQGFLFQTCQAVVAWLPVLLAAISGLCAWLYGLKPQWRETKITNAPVAAYRSRRGPSKRDWTTLDFSKTPPIAADHDWATTEERPYRPWHDGPHYVTMGIQKSALDDWVEIDKTYLARYNYKRYLYATHLEETIAFLPCSVEPAHEALTYLVDFLPRRYPAMFEATAVGIRNKVTGDDWDLRCDSATWDAYTPLQVMGLLTTEDWFIMRTDDDDNKTTRLVAGANCFPAGWKLRERMGHSLWEIHAGKVPLYEKNLAKSMDRFFLRLRADQAYMRFNYAVDVDKELFHIHSHHNLTAEEQAARSGSGPVTLEQLHLRVERQVLQRLPRTGAIAFSIRTYVTPITTVTRDRVWAKALRTNVNSYSPQVAQYKNKALWEKVLAEHLDEVIGPEDGDMEG
ncbi:hypothetical protein SEUCBS140593_010728 [Sporothrix eucalyptigena]|uniref:Uncharacterized protein n=1 Tax=Sporothrix eucalyptigena TaxID=1812306 RepID=A0ABP0D240_9PEZI